MLIIITLFDVVLIINVEQFLAQIKAVKKPCVKPDDEIAFQYLLIFILNNEFNNQCNNHNSI